MALKTLGTNLTTTLSAVAWQPAGVPPADFASLNQAIGSDLIGTAGTIGNDDRKTYFDFGSGILDVPGRGRLQLRPGDYIAVDSAGWPIVISGQSISYGSTSWTHT